MIADFLIRQRPARGRSNLNLEGICNDDSQTDVCESAIHDD
jgi:hypothetical protein